MNVLGAGLMDGVQLRSVVTDVSALLTDADTGSEIVVYGASERSYDPRSGTVGFTESAATVTGWSSELTVREVGHVQGARVGDRKVLVAVGSLSAAPVVDGRLSIGGVAHSIYHVESGPLATHYLLYARRVT